MGVFFLVVGVITCADRQASKRRIQVYSWTIVGLLVATVYGLFALRTYHTGSDMVSGVVCGEVGCSGVGQGVMRCGVLWGGVLGRMVCDLCVLLAEWDQQWDQQHFSPPLPSPVGWTDDICNL